MAESKPPAAVLDSLSGAEIKQLAGLLAKMGRNGDTILAHITPEEAAMLKKSGGAGTKNPETGLPEFNDGGDGGDNGGDGGDNGGDSGGSDGSDGGDAGGTDAGVGGGDDGADAGGAAGDAGPGGDDGSGGVASGGNDGHGGNEPLTTMAIPTTAPVATAETPKAPTDTSVADALAATPLDSGPDPRTSRRASARNSRVSGVSSLRSDLMIGGGLGATSGLSIPT